MEVGNKKINATLLYHTIKIGVERELVKKYFRNGWGIFQQLAVWCHYNEFMRNMCTFVAMVGYSYKGGIETTLIELVSCTTR